MVRPPKAMSAQGHGSRACYIRGCRYPLCVEANRQYQRDYRDKLRGTHDQRMGPYRIEGRTSSASRRS